MLSTGCCELLCVKPGVSEETRSGVIRASLCAPGADERMLARERGLVGLGAAVPVLDTSAFPFSAIGLVVANGATNITTGRVWGLPVCLCRFP